MKKSVVLFSIFIGLNSIVLAFDDGDIRASISKLGGVDKFIKTLAESMSKNLPSQLDANTKLISVLPNGNILNFTHVITNVKNQNEITNKSFVNDFIKFQTNKICTSQVSKIVVTEYGATYHYQYLSVTGENLFVFDVNKSKCLK
jgi:hypothetical protein